MIHLLTVDQLLQIHDEALKRTGGSAGLLRDPGLLESAVLQPEMSFDGTELYPTIAYKAAALAFSLITNHIFIDGNKRVAHGAMEVFLVLNGWEVLADVREQEDFFLSLASGERDRDELTTWLEARLTPKNL